MDQQPFFVTKDGCTVFFNEAAERNARASDEAGAPIFDVVHYARLVAPGQRLSEVVYEVWRHRAGEAKGRFVDDQHVIGRVQEAYEAWRTGQATSDTGTPLEQWPQLDVAQVASLKHQNVRTVQQLAELPDASLGRIGPQARTLRDQAKEFLVKGKDEARFAKLQKQLNDQAAQLKILEDENNKLRAHTVKHTQPAPEAELA